MYSQCLGYLLCLWGKKRSSSETKDVHLFVIVTLPLHLVYYNMPFSRCYVLSNCVVVVSVVTFSTMNTTADSSGVVE